MTSDELSTMEQLIHYAEWVERFWNVLRSHPDTTELREAINAGWRFIEKGESDDV